MTMNPLELFGRMWKLLASFALLSQPISFAFAQRELTDIPIPNSEQERATFQVDEGWNVELFAGDPLLAKPIHMNWDNHGRLWVASSETYPQIKPGEPSNDKILILEDSNKDGQADRTIVFADGLLIPTGVLPANDGPNASAYVVNSDQLLYLKDTDGDLVADETQIVLSGFGTEDTHHLLHSLRWGHDGWIYMNQSIYIHSHIETPWGVQRLNGGGIWRFHPPTKRLEVVVRGFVNPWGVHFDRFGQMFATDGAYGEGINYAFPGSVFVTAVGAKRLMTGLNPGSPKHCSLEILSGNHWPESIRGSMVTNDFRAHRVCRFKVTDDQSGYESVQQAELIKTPHVAFRPIDAKQGLDGALYIADWYNPIIQHGEVDFRDPRRDRTHGRIWRLTHRDAGPTENQSITSKDPIQKNLDRLSDDSDLVRLFAGQAIRASVGQSDARSIIEAHLLKVAADRNRGLEQLELAWVLEGLGIFDARLQSVLATAEDGRLRAAYAHQVANQIRWVRTSQFGKLDASQLAQWSALGRKLANDPHPRVRLEAVRLLSELPTSDAANAATDILKHPMDRFLDFALWQTLRDLAPTWLPEFRTGKFRFQNDPASIAFALRAVEDPSTIDAILSMLDEKKTGDADAALAAKPDLGRLVAELGNGSQQARLVERLFAKDPIPLANESSRTQILQSILDSSLRRKEVLALPETTQIKLLELAKLAVAADRDGKPLPGDNPAWSSLRSLGPWRVKDARSWLEQVAVDPTHSSAIRQAALRSVSNYGDDAAKALLQTLITDSNVDVAIAAIENQADIDLPRSAQSLVERLVSDPARAEPLSALAANLLSRKDGLAHLTHALGGKSIDPAAARQLKSAVRKMNASADLLGAIDSAGKLQENRWLLNEEVRNRWLDLAKTQGDASNGEWIYRRSELQCIQCHRIGGVGGLVGPDLSSIGAQAPADYLLEALLNPAAKVKEGYNAKLVRTDDEEILAGIPVRESDDDVVLRLADGKEVSIAKSNIADIKDSRSLMPDGLLDSLTEAEAIDLLRFITELGKIDGSMLVKPDGSIRSWDTLAWTEKAFVLFNRTSLDSIVGDPSNFVWQAHPALVSGEIPTRGLPTYRPHATMPNYTFLRSKLNVAKGGSLRLDLGDIPKGAISIWAGGKPIPVDGSSPAIPFADGESWIFVGVNRDLIGDRPIRIRVDTEGSTAKLAP
ncbi:MAG: PVC-type heme-binding CxxCH protein [Planctomycetota bacterium]